MSSFPPKTADTVFTSSSLCGLDERSHTEPVTLHPLSCHAFTRSSSSFWFREQVWITAPSSASSSTMANLMKEMLKIMYRKKQGEGRKGLGFREKNRPDASGPAGYQSSLAFKGPSPALEEAYLWTCNCHLQFFCLLSLALVYLRICNMLPFYIFIYTETDTCKETVYIF